MGQRYDSAKVARKCCQIIKGKYGLSVDGSNAREKKIYVKMGFMFSGVNGQDMFMRLRTEMET